MKRKEKKRKEKKRKEKKRKEKERKESWMSKTNFRTLFWNQCKYSNYFKFQFVMFNKTMMKYNSKIRLMKYSYD